MPEVVLYNTKIEIKILRIKKSNGEWGRAEGESLNFVHTTTNTETLENMDKSNFNFAIF
jgi:hypothetical protein